MCQECGNVFKTKCNLQMHCLSQHTSPEEKDKLKIKCEVPGCDYASIFKNKLKRHNITVHLKQRNHCCQHCAKTFSSLSAMKEHINGVHLNLKPLLCDICEFATACKFGLFPHAHYYKLPFIPYLAVKKLNISG